MPNQISDEMVEAMARHASLLHTTPAHECASIIRSALAVLRKTHAVVPREPTEAMWKAGGMQMCDIVGSPYGDQHWMHYKMEVGRVYRAMIAAAEGGHDAG